MAAAAGQHSAIVNNPLPFWQAKAIQYVLVQANPEDLGNTTLFIGALSSSVTEEELKGLFGRFGPVVYCKIPSPEGRRPRTVRSCSTSAGPQRSRPCKRCMARCGSCPPPLCMAKGEEIEMKVVRPCPRKEQCGRGETKKIHAHLKLNNAAGKLMDTCLKSSLLCAGDWGLGCAGVMGKEQLATVHTTACCCQHHPLLPGHIHT